jgi:hypothetical protein
MMTTSNRISGGFVAKWEGTCGKCAQPIHIGDRITQNGAGRPAVGYYGSKRYAHVSCGIVREAVAVVAAASIEQEKAEEAKQVSPVIATLVNDWIGVVQKTRALVSQIGAKIVVSPRASIKGAQLLRAGIAPKFIVEAIFGRYRAETAWTQVGIHAEEFAKRSGLIETDRKWIKAAAKAGTQHKAFKSLVMLAMALNGEDKNIWLAGPQDRERRQPRASLLMRSIWESDSISMAPLIPNTSSADLLTQKVGLFRPHFVRFGRMVEFISLMSAMRLCPVRSWHLMLLSQMGLRHSLMARLSGTPRL